MDRKLIAQWIYEAACEGSRKVFPGDLALDPWEDLVIEDRVWMMEVVEALVRNHPELFSSDIVAPLRLIKTDG